MKNIHPAFLPDVCFSKRELKSIKGIIIHYFSAINAAPKLKYDFDTCWNLFVELNMPETRGLLISKKDTRRYYASAHIMMSRTGDCSQLVPFNKQAYHAGKSEWKGMSNLNAHTYGIELIAAKGEAYEEEQYIELAKLIIQLWNDCGKTFPLSREGITGHEDIAVPLGRKVDPGPLFDWDKLFTYINTNDCNQ